MKLKIVISPIGDTKEATLVTMILDYEGISYQLIQNHRLVSQVSRGTSLMVILDANDNLIGTDYREVFFWLEKSGLFQI